MLKRGMVNWNALKSTAFWMDKKMISTSSELRGKRGLLD